MAEMTQTSVLSSQGAPSIACSELQTAGQPIHLQREAEKPAATEMCHTNQPPLESEMKKVVIPDLFISFVSQRPRVNPHYEVMKKESEAWMKRYETQHYLSLHENKRPRWRLKSVSGFAVGLKKSTSSISVLTFLTSQPYGQRRLAQMSFGPSAIGRIG